MNLAPIIVFCYNRPDHLAQTFEALKNNELASESELYVYCDGAKANASPEAIHNILTVRKLAKEQTWAKHTNVIESNENKGLAASIITGVTEVLEKYGRAIVLEDDLITASSFLLYMNNALNFYEHRKSVFSVGGFCPSRDKFAIPMDYQYDTFVCQRNTSWGWATWKDRWEQVDWGMDYMETFLRDNSMQSAFARGGDDIVPMLCQQYQGKINSWAVRFSWAHFYQHAVAIIPCETLVNNIGCDGSGTNCGASSIVLGKLSKKQQWKFVDCLYENADIVNAFYNVNCWKRRPFLERIINTLCRIIGVSAPFVIKRKIYAQR